VRSSRRVVYTLIEGISQDEFGLLALTTIKNFDEYTYNHSLNVGVLALALAQRIGLDRKSLVQIGTAGLLHDIGKVEISKELLYKSSKLDDEEHKKIELHSTYAVRQIIRTRGLDRVGISSMIAAYQHHWNYDGSGYPQVKKEDFKPILYSKIIRICDAYDAMTTSRPYQIVPYLPNIAIRVIWVHRNSYFDPILSKIFIELLGLYPVGSCLELNTKEIGISISQNPGHFDLPTIKVVMDKKGNKIDGRVIDLTLEQKVKIIQSVYPQKYKINPAVYLL
jgi:putative nucleotidyltransferase with HDIG domain